MSYAIFPRKIIYFHVHDCLEVAIFSILVTNDIKVSFLPTVQDSLVEYYKYAKMTHDEKSATNYFVVVINNVEF